MQWAESVGITEWGAVHESVYGGTGWLCGCSSKAWHTQKDWWGSAGMHTSFIRELYMTPVSSIDVSCQCREVMYNGGMEVNRMTERYADWDCTECGQIHDPSLKHAEQTMPCPHCRAQDKDCTLCFGTGKVSPSQAEEWRRQNQ